MALVMRSHLGSEKHRQLLSGTVSAPRFAPP